MEKVKDEKITNEKLFKFQLGKRIFYGTEILLRHIDSGAYIQAGKTCAEIDKSSNKIILN